jgi:hypothetical protein
MPEEPVHRYDFSHLQVFEVGTAILTLLAYPEPNSEERRAALHASLCALTVRAMYPLDSESASQPQPIKPIHAFRTQREIDRDLRTMKRRHRDRMIAGRMAIAFLQKAQGITPRLPATAGRLSINALSALVAEDAGYADPENVETRIWRPSLPVIHLAAAVQILLNASSGQIHAGHLVNDRAAIEWVVRTAEEFGDLLARSRYRGIDASKLIRIRLARS